MSRNSVIRTLVVGFALAALAGPAVLMQSQQTQTYRAPRTKDGKPDLNGIWQAVNTVADH